MEAAWHGQPDEQGRLLWMRSRVHHAAAASSLGEMEGGRLLHPITPAAALVLALELGDAEATKPTARAYGEPCGESIDQSTQ
jgi:hypothetical protein